MDNEGAGEFGSKHTTDSVLSINTLLVNRTIPNSLLQNKAIDYFLHQRQDFFTSNSNITQQDRLLCLRQIRDGAINSGRYQALINQLPSPLSHINTHNSEQALENLYTQLQGNNSDHRQMRRIIALLTKGSLQPQDQVKKEDLKVFGQAQPSAIEYEQFFTEVIRNVNQANKPEDREQKRQEYIESFDNLGNILYGMQWQYLKQLRLLEQEAHKPTLPHHIKESQKRRTLNLITSTFGKFLPSKAFSPFTRNSFIRGSAALALAAASLGAIQESSKTEPPAPIAQGTPQEKEKTKVIEAPQVVLKEAPLIEFGGSFGDVDSNSPTHWDKGTIYTFNSSLRGVTRYSGTNIGNLGNPEIVTFDKQISGNRWIEATYPHNGKLYGWYHQEQFDYDLPKRDQVLTIPRIGAIVSEDNGKTWKDLGFVVDTPPNSINPDTINLYFAGGNGDFSVMPDQTGEYFYFFTTNYDKDVTQQGVAMARIKTSDLSDPKGKVWKWYEDKWQEPGEGGKVIPIFPVKDDVHKPEADFFWGPSVHWNEHLQTYVIVMSHSENAAYTQEGIYMSFNADLSNPQGWSNPQKIKTGKTATSWYPQIVGLGNLREGTDKASGKDARLFERGESSIILEFKRPEEQETLRTLGNIDTPNSTFFRPGSNEQIKLPTGEKQVEVLRPAGKGRFIVQTSVGIFEVPMDQLKVQGNLSWQKEVKPLSWLGFDSSNPNLIDKIPQIGAGVVRIPVNKAEEELDNNQTQVAEAIKKAKKENLEILLLFNPTEPLSPQETAKKLDKILAHVQGYDKVLFELGNEPDIWPFWKDQNLDSYAQFVKQASAILKQKRPDIKQVIAAASKKENIDPMVNALKAADITLDDFILSLHSYSGAADVEERVRLLQQAAGVDVKFMFDEIGINTSDEAKSREVPAMIETARKLGAQRVIVFKLDNHPFEGTADKGLWGYVKPEGTWEKPVWSLVNLAWEQANLDKSGTNR